MKKFFKFALIPLILIILFIVYFYCFRTVGKDTIPIITYHSIQDSNEDGNPYIIKTESFEEMVKGLKENGFTFLSLSDVEDIVYNGKDLPEKPILITYQARVSEEFVKCSEEKQLSYLKSFIDGLSKKVAQAIDIASFHGLEPKSMTDASFKATNSFDGLITGNVVAYEAGKIDENILFYIMSRGFDKKQAESMMLEATFAKTLDKIEDESLREELKKEVRQMNTRN